MPGLSPVDDPWVGQQATTYDVSELEDTSIAIDATYFIQYLLDNPPSHEPLMSALAGLTSLELHINNELDRWEANKILPFFIFDGQPVVGQDEVTIAAGIRDNARTDSAWALYFGGRANEAVSAFGAAGSIILPQSFYPLLQKILNQRKLHFLVPPYNAAAQIACFDMVDSEQCGGIMGSQELLLYPIHDCVIRSIDWESKTVLAVSKKHLLRSLNVSEYMFIDALLMTGTSFLPPFPPLRDSTINPRPPSVMDASNMLRTSEKNIANLCASFHDILQTNDPNWLDKFRKARMAIDHFIYIAESGAITVNDFDKLTGDNHEYLGFQLPAELYHYLNSALIGPRVLSWITYGQVTELPTVDGYVTDEYRNLVTKQLVPYHEAALGLVVPRLNRGLHFRDITLKVWYDNKFSLKLNHRGENQIGQRISKWNVSKEAIDEHFPSSDSGSIAFELSALENKGFVESILKAPRIKGIESGDVVVSLTLWKLLTIRGYINEDSLELTPWGVALAKTLTELGPVVKKHPDFPGIFSAGLLGIELIRLGLLTSKNQHSELPGEPSNGTEQDKSLVFLLSRTATLLQLRQDTKGYTGPLSKNLLNFHSLTTTVAEANRNIIDAVLASMFMYGQAKRERSDYWDISHRLPFYQHPDVALGIAVKTFLDETVYDQTEEAREAHKKEFPGKFVPCALHLYEDFDVVIGLVGALSAGVHTLNESDLSADVKKDWAEAFKYIVKRR